MVKSAILFATLGAAAAFAPAAKQMSETKADLEDIARMLLNPIVKYYDPLNLAVMIWVRMLQWDFYVIQKLSMVV